MFGVYSQLERRVFDPRSSRPTVLITRQLRLVASVIFLVTLFFLFYQESPRLQYRKLSLTHPSLSLSLKEAVTGPDQGPKVLSPPGSGDRGADATKPFIYRSKSGDASRDVQIEEPVETEKSENEQRSADRQTPLVELKKVGTETETADAAVTSSPTGGRYWGADIDWSQFAYTQYVTDGQYLCNAVMIFEALNRLGSRPDRLLLYPSYMLHDPSIASNDDLDGEARLLLQARDEYDVKLMPIEVAHQETYDETWADSFTELLAFNQTSYARILALDSDATVLDPPDELFLLPSTPVAMPRAYWLLDSTDPVRSLSSHVLLLQPSAAEFARVQARVAAAEPGEYGMEVLNDLYLDSALVIPHRGYAMLSAEFRGSDEQHALYLGSADELWDPVAAYEEARVIHFSDWPAPKPWVRMSDEERDEHQPQCVMQYDGREDCTERRIWNSLYQDFWERRQKVCRSW